MQFSALITLFSIFACFTSTSVNSYTTSSMNIQTSILNNIPQKDKDTKSAINNDHGKQLPKPSVLFFDCDDCLYFNNWKLADRLTSKIEEWSLAHGLRPGEAYELYKEYGTALRGMISKHYIEDSPEAIDEYLEAVHDIPIHEYLSKDNKLRQVLLSMDPTIPKYVFTASVRAHAERCLHALGIEDLFVDIIDVKSCGFVTKHSREAFEAAMRIASVNDPERCLFLDDSVKNLKMAKEMGWRGILVGRKARDTGEIITCDDAENEIDCIYDLASILPKLFKAS